MVGRAVSQLCLAEGDEVIARDRKGLDISDAVQVDTAVDQDRPDVIINCAAWTDVDGCEGDHPRAMGANAIGPENLANASRRVGAGFVTISTDYVFDGKKQGFYTQRDTPNPLSVYAHSKLEGERRAQNSHARSIVVRTGFIFGPAGRNFLSTIVERAREGGVLKAIHDAYGTPTSAKDLAARLRELALRDLPGIYHVVNSGPGASYEEIVRAALEDARLDADVEVVSMDSLSRPAPRPKNSRLKCLLSEAIGLPPVRHWREALKEFVSAESQAGAAIRR
jgi:dTDP-4-dehydrorhamnose reductase